MQNIIKIHFMTEHFNFFVENLYICNFYCTFVGSFSTLGYL